MKLTYYLEVDPLPSNSAYSSQIRKIRGRPRVVRFLQDKPRNWKTALKVLFRLQDIERQEELAALREHKILSLEVWINWQHDEFYFKNGKLQKRDTSGHLKLLEDALAEYLEIDDCYNVDLILHKRPSVVTSLWLEVKTVEL